MFYYTFINSWSEKKTNPFVSIFCAPATIATLTRCIFNFPFVFRVLLKFLDCLLLISKGFLVSTNHYFRFFFLGASQKNLLLFFNCWKFCDILEAFFTSVGYSFHPEMWKVVVAIVLQYYNNLTLQTEHLVTCYLGRLCGFWDCLIFVQKKSRFPVFAYFII